jgi:hypothetical protein
MSDEKNWRVVVVGGHTRSIGTTQLVCDLIAALPEGNWVAGKITQYGHGICPRNGHACDCAPKEHICAINWEMRPDTGTDSARFLAAGARRSFWLRTKQGFLVDGMPLLRRALGEAEAESGGPGNLILESNTLMQFWKPSLYLMVLHPAKGDFKKSAEQHFERASAFILRDVLPDEGATSAIGRWSVSLQGMHGKPQFVQREGESLPQGLADTVRDVLQNGGVGIAPRNSKAS